MYAKQKNKTALQSQQKIADALFHLMAVRPFHQITVTDLCKEAGVGRKTFYRNFELREDVIDFQLDCMREAYQKELTLLPPEQYLHHHFQYIRQHATWFISLYRSGLDHLAYEKFSAIVPDTMPLWSEDPVEQEYRSAYIIAGIEAIQRVWISRDCRESIEDVVQIALRSQEKQIPIA